MNDVKFNLKSPSSEKSLVVLVYRYSKGRMVLSTGIRVLPKHWNFNKQRLRELSGYMDYLNINLRLNKYERSLREAEKHFQKRDEVPSILELKQRVKNTFNGVACMSTHFNTVLGYLENYTTQREKNGSLAKSSISAFKQVKKVLRSVEDGRSLDFSDLSKDWLNTLTKHMVDEYSYSTNQIRKIQRRLITVVNSAKSEGYEINPAFGGHGWKVKASKINDSGITLSTIEVKRIGQIELNTSLDRVRDRFLIGLYTGQRYSDFRELNIDNVISKEQKRYFHIVQKKTGRSVKIPIAPEIERILTKYDGYPPVYSEPKFNLYIKDVCELAGINEELIIRKENPIAGVVSEKRKKKHQVISSHDCRRTYATILHDNGVPLGHIMQVTGHSSLASLTTYLKINMEGKREALDLGNYI